MRILLRLIVVAGLAVDAYIHFKIAANFDFKKGTLVSMGWLFRVQAGAAAAAALLVLVWANRLTYMIAFLVAGSAVGALLLYHYVDLGAIAGLPNMYDPVWYSDKVVTAVAEGVATVGALIGILLRPPGSRGSGGPLPGSGSRNLFSGS